MSIYSLGVVNVGWNSASILGVSLAVAGAGLYFLRSVRPELSRDYDIFFAAVGLACGGILLFNGWRLDPILQFGQFLLALSTFFFAFETLRLRGVATEQAKRSTPIVDDDRPVSRSYQAYRDPEYDELEPAYPEPDYVPRKRLRGSDDGYETAPPPSRRSRRAVAPGDRQASDRQTNTAAPYRDPEVRSRSRRESRRPERPERFERTERNPYPESERYSDQYDEWGEAWTEDYESETRSSRRNRPSDRRDDYADVEARDRRSDGRSDGRSEPTRRPGRTAVYEDEEPAPYVDYIDYEPDDDRDLESRDFESGRSRSDDPDLDDYHSDDYNSAAGRNAVYDDVEDDLDTEGDDYRAPRRRDDYNDDYGY
ncbi:MAG: Ycf66 family protein [Cyanobacteria bacterium P01_G01_bin.54]